MKEFEPTSSDVGGGEAEEGSSEGDDVPLSYCFKDVNVYSMDDVDIDTKPVFNIVEVRSPLDNDEVINKAWQVMREESGYNPLTQKAPLGYDRKSLSAEISNRSPLIEKATEKMYEVFKDGYGERDGKTISFSVVCQILPFFNQIASSQLEKYNTSDTESHSWSFYNENAAVNLKKTVSSIISDEKYKEFLTANPEFTNSLIILSALVDETDYEKVRNYYRSLGELRKQAQEQERPAYLVLETDDMYLDPDRNSDQKPKVWEAQVQLGFALLDDSQKLMEDLETDIGIRMAGLFHAVEPKPEGFHYNAVIGGGTEVLSVTQGQTSVSEECLLALNLVDKRREPWENSRELFGNKTTFSEVKEKFASLILAHELGHKMNNRVEEIRTDVPSILSFLYRSKEVSGGDTQFLKDAVEVLVVLYASESAETHKEGGARITNYERSSTFILNKLIEKGIINIREVEGSLKVDINVDEEALISLEDLLKETQKGFLTNDLNVTESIEKVQASDSTKKIVAYFS